MRNKKGFFTIIAWQKADDLVVKIYEITEVTKGYFPKHKRTVLKARKLVRLVYVLLTKENITRRQFHFPPRQITNS